MCSDGWLCSSAAHEVYLLQFQLLCGVFNTHYLLAMMKKRPDLRLLPVQVFGSRLMNFE